MTSPGILPQLNRRDYLPLAVLMVLPCLWWWPLLAGYLPDFMDTVTLQYPLRLAAAQQLWDGVIPLWLPNQMAGMPLLAHPEVALFYPLNLPFFLVPGTYSYGIIILLHYILAGLFPYFHARELRCPPMAAFVAGFGFQFGSFMVSHIALLPMVTAMPWIFLMLYLVEKDRERASSAWFTAPSLAIAVVYTVQVFAGASQFSFYSSFILSIYWLARGAKSPSPASLFVTARRGIITALIAAGLSSIQLLPTLDFVQDSARAEGFDSTTLKGQALNGSYLWKAIIGGTGEALEDTDSTHAIGIGLLLLAPFAFARKRTRLLASLLFSIGLLGFLMAMGNLTSFWTMVLPGFDSFRAPRRALVMWSVTGPILAALGLRNIIVYTRGQRVPAKAVAGGVMVLLIPTVLLLPRLEREFCSPERFQPGEDVLDVLNDRGRYLTIDPTLRYAHGSREEDYGDTMLPNLASWHDARDIQGYSSLILERYARVRDVANRQSGSFYPSHATIFSDPNNPLLRYLNVEYMIGRIDLYSPSRLIPQASVDRGAVEEKSMLIGGTERWPLHRIDTGAREGWMSGSSTLASSTEQALSFAASLPSVDRTVIYDMDEPPLSLPPASNSTDPIGIDNIEWLSPREVTVTLVEAATVGQHLVLSSTWHNGWQAAFDHGESAETAPAYGFLMATPLPAGVSEVTFSYWPKAFATGWKVSLGSLFLLILLAMKCRRKRSGESAR